MPTLADPACDQSARHCVRPGSISQASGFLWHSLAVNASSIMGVGRLGLGAVAAVGGAKAGKKAWDTLRQVGHGHGAQQVSEPS